MKSNSLVIFVAALVLVTPAFGNEAATEEEPAWNGELGLSLVSTSGNSDTQTLGFDALFSRQPDPWGIELGANFVRSEQDDEVTAERYRVHVRGKRAIGDRWEAFAGLSGEQDEFSGYDMRTIAETGVSYKAMLGPEHTLAFDVGLTWTQEEFIDDTKEDYLGGLVGLDYTWQITETTKLSHSMTWFPNFDEGSRWRATSETAIQAAMSSRLALKVGYAMRYENEPVLGLDDTDTTTTVSLVLSL